MIHNVAADAPGLSSNAFLVPGERTVLVDAGANYDAPAAVGERADDLDAVVLTHTHPDHVGTVADLRAAFDVETWGYDTDDEAVDREIADGDRVWMGDHEYEALYTPGHALDHLCLYAPESRVLFAGDLVFQDGSFGRTDLPGADRATLVESIDRLLNRIDEDLAAMHAGHGPSVTTDPYDHVKLAAELARR
ncbi:flavoprotein [Halobacteriales archaeon SW_7_68_16]|nr:MAG: flavoprotein [Halobacteriales archaeon SW_7_68_16]